MNILMGEVLGWCKDNVNWPDAVPLDEFQWMMALVATAAANPSQEKIWREQGTYLDSTEGKGYLSDIYKRREHLRGKMNPLSWRLITDSPVLGEAAGGE